jgi:hypothetical protein
VRGLSRAAISRPCDRRRSRRDLRPTTPSSGRGRRRDRHKDARLHFRSWPGGPSGNDTREGPEVCRLFAGAEWIRTFSSALDRQRFRGFGRVMAGLPAHRSSEQLPASAYRSSLSGSGPRVATHRPDPAASPRPRCERIAERKVRIRFPPVVWTSNRGGRAARGTDSGRS